MKQQMNETIKILIKFFGSMAIFFIVTKILSIYDEYIKNINFSSFFPFILIAFITYELIIMRNYNKKRNKYQNEVLGEKLILDSNTITTSASNNNNYENYDYKNYCGLENVYKNINIEKSLIQNIISKNPNFNKDIFKKKVYEYILIIEMAFKNKNIDILKVIESDTQFNIHKEILENNIKNNKNEIHDNIKIFVTSIVDYYEKNNNEYIKGSVSISCDTYYTDNKNNIITVKKPTIITYDIEMEKQVIKNKNKDIITNNCPYCGSVSDFSSIGVCHHCKRTLNFGDFNWKINSIKLYNGEVK